MKKEDIPECTYFKEEEWSSEDEKREQFGEGEWIEEVDQIYFDSLGFDLRIRRNHGGALLGYLKVPKDHPWHGKVYDDISIEVHGGLTYSEMEIDGYWIGFDCAHSGDICPSVEKMKDDPSHYFWKKDYQKLKERFPLSRLFNPTYKNLDFAINQCIDMAKQAKEVLA